MPPFGLLAVAECAGLAGLAPEPTAVGDLVGRVCAEIEPDYLAPDRVGKLLADSADWPEQYTLLQSWFEEGDDITALLKGRRPAQAKTIAAVLVGPIAGNRSRWAEMLAWMAMFTPSRHRRRDTVARVRHRRP